MATLGLFLPFFVARFVIFLTGDFVLVTLVATLLFSAGAFFGVVTFTFITVALLFLLAEEEEEAAVRFTGVLAAAFFRGAEALFFFTEERESDFFPFTAVAATTAFFVPTFFIVDNFVATFFVDTTTFFIVDNFVATFFVDTTTFLGLALTVERDEAAADLPEGFLTELTRFFAALPFPFDWVVLTIILNGEGKVLTAITPSQRVKMKPCVNGITFKYI